MVQEVIQISTADVHRHGDDLRGHAHGHDYHGHGHLHGGSDQAQSAPPQAADVPFSLLLLSAWHRLALAGGLAAFLWVIVWWALK